MTARVVTLTVNPALDDYFTVPHLRPDRKLRASRPRTDPGGGGVNVARVLHVLGVPVVAVLPVAGRNGGALVDLLEAEGVATGTLEVPGETRQSHTVRDRGTALEYRFVLPGQALSGEQLDTLVDLMASHAVGADFVVLSGSLDDATGPGLVAAVERTAAEAGARLVVDTSGSALRAVRGAYLLKPSVAELELLAGRTLVTVDEQVEAALAVLDAGAAEVVAVSRGADGLLLVTGHEVVHAPAPPTKVVSTVGAGDALVAGLVAARCRGWDLERAGRFAVACSAAMIGTPGTAMFGRRRLARFTDELAERPHPARA